MRGRWWLPVNGAIALLMLAAAFWLASMGPRQPRDLTPAPTPRPAEVLPVRSDPATPLAIPVADVRPDQLSDTFAQARAGGERRHDAIDIMAPRGTPVVAAAPGRVEKLFLSEDGGHTVYVRSPDGRRLYYYAHLDGYAAELREGMVLEQGAAIGTVGTSGNADPAAPHLHFEVLTTSPESKWWDEAVALNPYPLLVRR